MAHTPSDSDQIDSLVEQIVDSVTGGMDAVTNSGWSRSDIVSKVQSYKQKNVSDERTVQAVANRIRKDLDRDVVQTGATRTAQSQERVLIEEISRNHDWVTLVGTVSQDWGGNGGAISQAGLLRDATGEIRFVSWEKSDVPQLEVGETYELSVLAIDEHEGQISVCLNRQTKIDEQAHDQLTDKRGVAEGYVRLGTYRGERQRCGRDGCVKRLFNNRCPRHGETDHRVTVPEAALVIDSGQEVTEVVCDCEFLSTLVTEQDTTECIKTHQGEDVLSQSVEQQLLGRAVSIHGPLRGGKVVAEEWSQGDSHIPGLETVKEQAQRLSV